MEHWKRVEHAVRGVGAQKCAEECMVHYYKQEGKKVEMRGGYKQDYEEAERLFPDIIEGKPVRQAARKATDLQTKKKDHTSTTVVKSSGKRNKWTRKERDDFVELVDTQGKKKGANGGIDFNWVASELGRKGNALRTDSACKKYYYEETPEGMAAGKKDEAKVNVNKAEDANLFPKRKDGPKPAPQVNPKRACTNAEPPVQETTPAPATSQLVTSSTTNTAVAQTVPNPTFATPRVPEGDIIGPKAYAEAQIARLVKEKTDLECDLMVRMKQLKLSEDNLKLNQESLKDIQESVQRWKKLAKDDTVEVSEFKEKVSNKDVDLEHFYNMFARYT